jgi:hypothetical protein
MEGNSNPMQGNQNARKHGFYSKVLDDMQRLDYEHATLVEGLDDEIALLRVKIKALVEHDPENVRLITQAMNSLTRMVIARYDIRKDDRTGLAERIARVLQTAGPVLGIWNALKK